MRAMMHTRSLYLLRHAKAESATLQSPDEDRALSNRGIDDAKKLATKLIKKEIRFDLILTSPAIRAITTAQIISNQLDHKQRFLEVDKKLYQADCNTLLQIASKLHKKIKRVMLVGHNPALEDFVSLIVGESVSMQTCALIELSFEFKDWKDLDKATLVKMKLLN
jgi:phosphohistidine phosphatase